MSSVRQREYWEERKRLGEKYRSSTHYVLSALVPYTEANMKLAFLPTRFFNDLDKLDHIKIQKKSLRTAYYRAIKKGLIEVEGGIPRLTHKGRKKIKAYKPAKLKGACLMVIFDIPEEARHKRNHLRTLLKELSFEQIQKSVWTSDKDHREYLTAEIAEHGLQGYVKVFESRPIKV